MLGVIIFSEFSMFPLTQPYFDLSPVCLYFFIFIFYLHTSLLHKAGFEYNLV